MRISREMLQNVAEQTGFRAEILDKVIQLLHLLECLQKHPFLKGRLVLKGGTALNLFVFDVPRLSVDLDLNYVGAADREAMLAERPRVEKAVQAVCEREGIETRRMPREHAGGKWLLRYERSLEQVGTLQIDIGFMFRIPLWPLIVSESRPIGSLVVRGVPVLDIHELAAGKLAALLARRTSRDLFDVHQILTTVNLDPEKLRTAFVAYGGMNRIDWRTIAFDAGHFESRRIKNHLNPLLRRKPRQASADADSWAEQLIEECRDLLDIVLPMSEAELEFLERLNEHGEIEPRLLTDDEDLAGRIRRHPALEWKALNVRRHKGMQ